MTRLYQKFGRAKFKKIYFLVISIGSGLHILAQFLVALKYTINHIIKATFLHVASDGYDTQFWPVNTSIRHVSHDL